jgi:prepilin-type N-terminal cleavage/methylation domain-containing protein/prepilin-type processing-associated H-X9-DG protein
MRLTRKGLRPDSMTRQGFTLVELLVVLAILGILGSMLLPVLAKAQSRAKSLKCVSNFRQWGLAMNVYAAENEDGMPRDGTDADGRYAVDTGVIQGPGSPADPNAWFNALPAGIAERPLSNYWASARNPRQDLPFPGGKGPVWHCPAARWTSHDQFLKDGAFGFFSMVMNIDLKLLTSLRNEPGSRYEYPKMPKFSSIPHPAATVLFTDAAFSPTLEPYTPSPARNGIFPAGRSGNVSQRHSSRGANIVFVDGHIDLFRRSYITNGGPWPEEKLNPDVVWNPNREVR